ncbi:E3 ubiquitin-protein ligase AIRP2 [Cynara cardunculus var. scolymus]|uniref:E3 ubiquitin-protein ligase AIRP2 n=1 Tax=Cynara cardunculus var. scolymus TaxID=59895 RepID=UPI000D6304DA|nr:E3 ubiquitin-protein ligase AIRP2 [Cynara cardunculus var. scolymus]
MVMGKIFKDSLKALEADIQHANTLALSSPRDQDGASLQMRLSFSPAVDLFSFLFPWTDCKMAGALGLLRIFIYMTYADGKTTMSVQERKASIKQFYDVIFPSIMQLQSGITDLEERKQKEICSRRYSRKDGFDKGKLSDADAEREFECGICMETNSRVVLPNCSHSLCLKCYRDWHGRSRSCPFCRDSLTEVNVSDLWICVEAGEIVDLSVISKENKKRLFMYIEKLPLVIPGFLSDSHLK